MENSPYPCPGCGQPANLTIGCPACGRGPDPVAAEVIRLDGEITALTPRVEQARQVYLGLSTELRTRQERRADLAARVRSSRTRPVVSSPLPVGAGGPTPVRPVPGAFPTAGLPGGGVPQFGPVPPVGTVPPVGPVPPGGTVPPGGAETSGRAVQGLLFVLGGLLLGTAAVVFTAVAWAAVGVAGRALILLAFTALALAVPLVAVRRGLRGTAETFAAVGLLLVLLDGYAAWTVDLFGVTGWPGTRYAALVGGASAAVAVGYGRLSRLAVPWFAALLAVQPVLPLLAVETRPGVAGAAVVLTGTALVNLAVVAALRGGGALVSAGRVTAWIGYGSVLVAAAGCGLVALASGEVAGSALPAGLPLLLVAAALLGGAVVAGSRTFQRIAAGLLTVVLGAAAVRPLAELRPAVLLVGAALVALALAGAVRLLPAGVRPGPRVGALVVAGILAQVTVVVTGVLALMAVGRSRPAWQGAGAGPELAWGWQLPTAALLVAVALTVLLPKAAGPATGLGGLTVVVLAVPAAWATPWPVVVVTGTVVGAALLLGAVLRPAAQPALPLVAGGAGGVLVGHALLVALAAPAAEAAVLGTLVVTGVVVAALGRRHGAVQRVVAGSALAVALLVAPVALVTVLFAVDVTPWWQLRAGAAAAGLLSLALVAVRRHWPDLREYAATAFAVAVAVAALAPLVVPADEPVSGYAALALLVVLLSRPGSARPGVGTASRSGRVEPAGRVVGAGLLVVAVAAVAPAGFAVLVVQYGWLGAIWSGVPDGVGLLPGVDTPGLAPGAALLVLTAVAFLTGRSSDAVRSRSAVRPSDAAVVSSGPVPDAAPAAGSGRSWGGGRWWLAATVGALAVPVLLAGAGARWPVVPAAALLLGLAGTLARALATRAPVLAPVGLLLAGSGLAGLLPTRFGTLIGLGLTLVTAVAIGAAGRALAARLAGWAVATATATGFAATAALAGGAPLRAAAFAVLAVAGLALAGAPALARRRPVEARAMEYAAQSVALVALLLTVGAQRHAAAVCTLWGAAVAVRVLRRGEPAVRRRAFAAIAGASELLGAWLLLAAGGVVLLEAYTLPAAVLVIGAGLLALRGTPGLNSWLALGPGLAAALLPSLVSVLFAADPQPWRRLLLGAGALAVVLVGAVRRWQAPALLGGVTLTLLALHETVRGWDLLPRWVFLAVGGFALIALASTYERRRRDLARLRATVARMS